MNNHQKITATTHTQVFFSDAQKIEQTLRSLVKKFGSEKVSKMLTTLDSNTSATFDQVERIDTIKEYLIAQAIVIFHLERDKFYTNETQDYREARMVCYNLMDVYTECSHAQIGRIFNGKSKQSIQRYCQRCKENYLSVPQFCQGFCDQYGQLEALLIEFIGKHK